MRFKEYFADGLLNIAILLSLLRTDLNNVVDRNYRHYPEVQDILHGQTAAISLTNFNNYIDSLHGRIHPKSPDNNIDTIIQDLRSLSRLGNWQRTSDNGNNGGRGISAFLASTSTLIQQPVVSINNQHNDNNNNNEDVDEGDIQDDELTAALNQGDEIENNAHNEFSLYENNDFGSGAASPDQQTEEPTSEDLDLIDVLWRQDIDLGVGKEVFDINLRQELERERELELQKDREKQKEREVLQCKHEEQRLQQQRRWLTENFMQDTETGEWVPLRGRASSGQPPIPNSQLQNFMPYDNNMTVVSEPPPLEGDYGMPEHQYQHTSQTMAPPQAQPSQMMTGFGPDMANYTAAQQNPEQYTPMESLEERWQDLVNLLELPENDTSMRPPMGMGPVNQTVVSPTDHNSVLIQNATLPVAPQLNNTLPTPYSNTSIPQQPMTNFTSTSSSEGCPTPLDWEQSELFYNNGSGGENHADPIEDMESILPDIIPEDYNLTEMALNDGLRSMRMLDDNSSESGVSLGSSEQDQFSEAAMSPFDSLEGATGGHDYSGGSPGFNKASSFEHNNYSKFNGGGNGYNSEGDNYNSVGDSYSSGGSSNGDSAHSSSNDTDFNFPSTKTSHNHIRHNHSYPLQPGQSPREYKKYCTSMEKEPRHKGPHCKDSKRIQELKVPLTVDEIVDVPVEEFNELLTQYKLTEPQLQLIRDIRRRGKNKVAAQNCRKRKLDVLVNLEDDMSTLQSTRDRLLQERHTIDKQTREMKDKFSSLYREIFQSLRDEHGRPYDPHLFSLQQSSDGNVFLVPRNITADEQQAKSKKKKNEKK
ncbi:nuclear factor erythroid 2-related factor 1-like isoform X1 [Mizuhopecten yessoensis]|uniref:Nuclear factor erythroid 2-related factor 2 n=1 Tax=Mizuhopecten yessoensis TaxID=6573 RepID=A0A210QVC3_MIZYE|nr:nuclear factor erythroid 2-related factor 1-like isoform X1 [Mizuhopecten yessoensis]OWF52699.1 Nuclear factor erythroid 2-related factor 2 [Mizuhopecten yessoensis]